VINCRIIGLNIQIRSLIFTVGLDGPICASTLSPSRLKNFLNFTCKCRYGSLLHKYFWKFKFFFSHFYNFPFSPSVWTSAFCACYFASTPNRTSPFSDTQTQNRHPLATPLPPIAENSDNYDRICCFLCCMFLLR